MYVCVYVGGNFTVSLYTQHSPYTNKTLEEFDPSLGRHDDFLLLGPYIYAQKTDSRGVISLYISYNRGNFSKTMIPSSQPHVVKSRFTNCMNVGVGHKVRSEGV